MRRNHWVSGFTLLLCSALARPGLAEAPPEHAEARPEVKGPLAVTVELEGYELDPTTVQLAVARELGVAVTPASDAAQGSVRIVAKKGAELSVVYQAPGQPPMMRSVAAPARDDEVAEAAALLIGNLARDESSALIASLQPEPEAEPEPPPAEPSPAPASVEAQPRAPVNLSVFHPLTIVPHADQTRLAVELGLFYSRVGAVDAFSLNPLVLQVQGPASGVQIAGVASFNGAGGTGLRIAGAFALDDGDFRGASVTGAARVKRGDEQGFGAAGAVTYQDGNFTGMMTSGAVSVSSGAFEGLQVSGAVNVARGGLTGAQLSSVVNVSDDVHGLQASVANVGDDVTGAQLGLVNIGGRVRGLQLGLVNVADDIDGASIGMVTWSKNGRVQPTAWYGTASAPANVGVRFYTGPLFAMPTLGFDMAADPSADDGAEVATFTPGLSLGARIPVQRAFVDLEANYGNRAPEFRFDEHTIDLHYRVWVGFEVTGWFAPMVGGGVLHQMQTEGEFEDHFEPELTLGVQFL